MACVVEPRGTDHTATRLMSCTLGAHCNAACCEARAHNNLPLFSHMRVYKFFYTCGFTSFWGCECSPGVCRRPDPHHGARAAGCGHGRVRAAGRRPLLRAERGRAHASFHGMLGRHAGRLGAAGARGARWRDHGRQRLRQAVRKCCCSAMTVLRRRSPVTGFDAFHTPMGTQDF